MDRAVCKMVAGNPGLPIGFDVELFIYSTAPINGGDHAKE